jgi:hypothetical protein
MWMTRPRRTGSPGDDPARFRNNEDPQYHIFGANYQNPKLLSGNPDEVVKYEIGIRSIANTFPEGAPDPDRNHERRGQLFVPEFQHRRG